MGAVSEREFRTRKGVVVRRGVYRPSAEHPEDRHFSPELAKPAPKRVDLRDELSHVVDQLELESCVANAAAGAYELLEKRATKRVRRISRLFVYYNARANENDAKHDDGATIRAAVRALRIHGACAETTWPYVERRVLDRPDAHAYEEARKFRISEALRVAIDLDAMRSCVAAGLPFLFGVKLYESFEAGGDHGHVPLPDPPHDKSAGGHTMLAVGYDDGAKTFIVRNSWGPDWGEEGYCFLPYDYVASRRFCDEAWTMTKLDRAT
jgi:C1A family cysteine protease